MNIGKRTGHFTVNDVDCTIDVHYRMIGGKMFRFQRFKGRYINMLKAYELIVPDPSLYNNIILRHTFGFSHVP